MDELINNIKMTQIVDPCPICSNPKGLCVECENLCKIYLSEKCIGCGQLYLPTITNCCC